MTWHDIMTWHDMASCHQMMASWHHEMIGTMPANEDVSADAVVNKLFVNELWH